MATLIELEQADRIFRYDPALDGAGLEVRRIYVMPRARDWLVDTLPDLGSTWKIEESPLEQFDAFMEIFCSGKPLSVGTRIRCLTHLGEGIWELKTADLRLFGWFADRDCFVMTDGYPAEEVKRLKLYRPFCEQAVRMRDQLDLNEPKFVGGDNPDVVVSNCH